MSKFNFDGHGINDKSSEYAPRVATLSNDYKTAEIGNLLASAPELLEALESLLPEIWAAVGKRDVKKHYSLMVAEVAAQKAIAKARGDV